MGTATMGDYGAYLFSLGALILGGGAAWAVASARAKRMLAESQAGERAAAAALAERLASAQRDAERLMGELTENKRQVEALRRELDEAVRAKTTAEEKASRIPALETSLKESDGEKQTLRTQIASLMADQAKLQTSLEKERRQTEEKLALLEDAKTHLMDAFKALSAEALKSNNQSFLELAKSNLEKFQAESRGELGKRQQAIELMIQPIRESLDRTQQFHQAIEKERKEAYGELKSQIQTMAASQERLQSETANLVKALRAPQARGRWGEITLRRVAEMAGMIQYCDFEEQVSTDTEDGRLRPDMVVRLPNEQTIVVDAKAPLQGYLDALEAQSDGERDAAIERHARHIRDHVTKLANKSYWTQFESTPEFVVLFIPGENFFSTALQRYPDLIEEGVRQGVVIATPTTLIALLKAVAYGWKQESLAHSAREISGLGQTLYDRLATLASHFAAVGKALDAATNNYNRAVGSLEGSVLPAARRFRDLGVSTKKEIPVLEPGEHVSREIQAPELIAGAETEQGNLLAAPDGETESVTRESH